MLAVAWLPGLSFESVSFTPSTSAHRGKACHGVRVRVHDREQVDTPSLGLALLQSLRQGWPQVFALDHTLALVGLAGVIEGVRNDEPFDEVRSGWQPALKNFLRQRERFLMY